MRGLRKEPREHPRILFDRRLRNYSGMYDPFLNKLYLGFCGDEEEAMLTIRHEMMHWAHDLFLKGNAIERYMNRFGADDQTTITERLANWLEEDE